MRGNDDQQEEMFTYGSLEQRIAENHPLRRIRELTERTLRPLAGKLEDLYSHTGRPSIAPERLLRAMLLQVLYSIRSERALMDQIDLHLGFRWFVGLSASDPVWDASTFSKNRDRLVGGDIAREFLESTLTEARRKQWLSDDRFAVDGTLIEAWASPRSYQPKSNPPTPGAGSGRRGELQKRDLYESKTDPEARLFKKNASERPKLCYLGHVLSDMKHGMVAGACATPASTRAERDTGVELVKNLSRRKRRSYVAADKLFDEREFVRDMRALGVTPQVTQYTGQRSSAIDGRTTRHPSYAWNQRARRQIEKIFGWLKQVGGQRRTRFRGTERVSWMFTFSAAAYNLVRMATLMSATS
jgi:transposase